jgi:lactate permease
VVWIGVLLSSWLLEKGSLQRLSGMLTAGRFSGSGRSMLLSFGVGNFLEGAGVIAEPVAAPMLRASGPGPSGSAALSIMGYAGLMHLSLAGVIVVVLSTVTGIAPAVLARDLAMLSFAPTVLLCLAVPWFAGEDGAGFAARIALPAGVGFTAAGAAWLCVLLGGYSIAGMAAGLAVLAVFYAAARRLPPLGAGAWRDLAPFALLFVCLGLVNLVPPLRGYALETAVVRIGILPDHSVAFRPLFDAWGWLALAFIMAWALHRGPGDKFWRFVAMRSRGALRVVAAMALFGAMGQVIAYSGYGPGFMHPDAGANMALVLAEGAITGTGALYPVFAPLLGWVGTFLTGYGVASIMLFGKLQLAAAESLGVPASQLAGLLTVGASVGSVSSPFKIALAAALCGAQGKEGAILRQTIPLGLGVALATGAFSLLFL